MAVGKEHVIEDRDPEGVSDRRRILCDTAAECDAEPRPAAHLLLLRPLAAPTALL